MRSIFDFLEAVQKRPSMYVSPERALEELEQIVNGYLACQGVHGINEPGPKMGSPFSAWLRIRDRSWSLSSGWALAVAMYAPAEVEPLEFFFELVSEYRQLEPTVALEVDLAERNHPTGRRYLVGFEGRMERPKRVQVIRYAPAPLHVLRFIGGERAWEMVLQGPNAAPSTTLEDAMSWLKDEFNLRPDDIRFGEEAG